MRPGDYSRRSGHQRSPARSQKHPDEHQLRTKAIRAARIEKAIISGKQNRKNPGKRFSESTEHTKDPEVTTGQSGKRSSRSSVDNEIHCSISFAYWHISICRLQIDIYVIGTFGYTRYLIIFHTHILMRGHNGHEVACVMKQYD